MPADLPADQEAREAAAWSGFVQQLGRVLAAQWPAMPERLGNRYDAFVELGVAQADKRGLQLAASVARFVNLWFVWGPAFHDKPGFEWAQGLLAAPREREWLTLHQLVQRSMAELKRLPDARIQPQALADADALLLDHFGRLGRQGALLQPALPLPRKACDLEVAELRLQEADWHHEYRLLGDDWQRVAVAAPAPLRVDAAHALPPIVGLLSHAPGAGPQLRLQARVKPHALCSDVVHPQIDFAGTHGLWQWIGYETRAVGWPVAALAQPGPACGPGTAIGEETSPDILALALHSCGLRDEGDAIGTPKSQVWVWPADQWWIEVQRAAPSPQVLLPGPREWARGITRCRVENDGAAQDAIPLRRQFEDGLDAACAGGARALAGLWQSLPDLASPSLDLLLGLLTGKAAATWGWRASAGGMEGRALMRVVAALDMTACQADLQLGGELVLSGTRSTLRLRAAGEAPLRQRLSREAPEPPLLDALLPARTSFRFPFTAELEPLATDDGRLLQLAGPATGALVGEAGLRPRTSGGSGWEWFAGLRIEAVALPLCITDPLLGDTLLVHTLMPARTLVDWSVR